MSRAVSIEEILELQEKSVGYLLIRSAQLWNERAISRINAEGAGFVLREAHTRLFPFLLEPGGIRITELARRLSVTKQAIQPLVADMVRVGAVRLVADPEDGRARRVVLTASGARSMKYGTGILLGIEEELGAVLGRRRLAVLRELLSRLREPLEESALDSEL